jgi:regulator of RNase E activity RraA
MNDMGLAVFARGVVPAGPSKNGPGYVGKPVACGNVVCNPGDVVIGDADGIVVIPQSELTETLQALPGQEDIERQIRARIKETVALLATRLSYRAAAEQAAALPSVRNPP